MSQRASVYPTQAPAIPQHSQQTFPIEAPPPIENSAISCSACHSPANTTTSLAWCHFCAQSTCKNCFMPQKREIVTGHAVPICVRCIVLVKARQINQPMASQVDNLAEYQSKVPKEQESGP